MTYHALSQYDLMGCVQTQQKKSDVNPNKSAENQPSKSLSASPVDVRNVPLILPSNSHPSALKPVENVSAEEEPKSLDLPCKRGTSDRNKEEICSVACIEVKISNTQVQHLPIKSPVIAPNDPKEALETHDENTPPILDNSPQKFQTPKKTEIDSVPTLEMLLSIPSPDEDENTDWTKQKRIPKLNDQASCTDLDSTFELKSDNGPSYLSPSLAIQTFERSIEPSKWTTEDICAWCIEIGMSKYVNDFRQYVPDGQHLLNITTHSLKHEMLIQNSLDQRKLIMEITKLRVLDHNKI